MLDDYVWVVISFGNDGLERRVSYNKYDLIHRRKDNRQIAFKKIKVEAKKLRYFLLNYQKYNYHLLVWNCLVYSINLWLEIVREYPQFSFMV